MPFCFHLWTAHACSRLHPPASSVTGPLVLRFPQNTKMLFYSSSDRLTPKMRLWCSTARWPYEHALVCCYGLNEIHTKMLGFFFSDDLFLCISSCFPPAILWTGELWEFLSFTERYPSIIYNIMLFGVTSALGQVGGWTKDARDLPEIPHLQLTLLSPRVLTRPSFSWLWSTSDRWPAPSWQRQGSSSPSSARFFCLATPWALCSGLAPSWSSSVRVWWSQCFKTPRHLSDGPVYLNTFFHFRSWTRC